MRKERKHGRSWSQSADLNQTILESISLIQKYEKHFDCLWAAITLGMMVYVSMGVTDYRQWDYVSYIFIDVLVTALYLTRGKTVSFSKSWSEHGVALVSSFYIYAFDYEVGLKSEFSIYGNLFLLIGTYFRIMSLLSLGKSFGILPVLRHVKTDILYQHVRHPLYASYILMDLGIVIGYFSWYNVLIFVLGIVLFLARIRYEEKVLRQTEEYRMYLIRTPYRLFPKIY